MAAPTTWTPDGWKVFGNTNIWKLEEEIDFTFDMLHPIDAAAYVPELIESWIKEGFIDVAEGKYLMLYMWKCYDENMQIRRTKL